MALKKLFLFDLDGTLLDTLPNFAANLHAVLNMYPALDLPDIETLTQRIRPQVSHGGRAMVKACFQTNQACSESFLDEFYQKFIEQHHNNIIQSTVFFDGIPEILNQLKQKNIPWGIVTNKSTAGTRLLLDYFKILTESVVLVCGDTLKTAKPDPAPLYFACDTVGVSPQDTLFLGDSELDLKAGRAANIQTLFAGYGYGQCLPDHRSDHTIQDPKELLKWI